MSSLYLGVDGGQSSTTAVIGDATGRVIGFGRGGPCNHVKGPEGRHKFVSAMESCLADAGTAAGLQKGAQAFAVACLGFSGGPADKSAILQEMLPAQRILVTTDALIALSGATGGAPGVITIAGTGSIAFGRNADGKTARAGGWGYVFGDEGGGFDLVRQALRAALRMEEGWGPPTTLRKALLDATGADDANDALHRFYTADFPRPKIAALSKLVDDAAASGDPVAGEILRGSAQQLATYAGAVRRQLFREGESIPAACIGGVFRSEPLRERFRELMELEKGVRVGPPLYGPAVGALLEAYRAAGVAVKLKDAPKAEK